VRFIVDTSPSCTTIIDKDVERLRISYNGLKSDQTQKGILRLLIRIYISDLIEAATAIDESMPTAYVLINYDIGTEEKFIDKLKKVPGIVEVSEVNGVYDIVVKIASQTLDNLIP
jgi:DNA-binding Lrp family transcriptional regulator